MPRRLLPLLLASLAAAAPPEGASARLAAREQEFLGHGWSSRPRLRVDDAKEAASWLATLDEDVPMSALAPEDRLDERLMRHRLEGLLEAWRELDQEHRDVLA